jgi:hypothetical protein
MSRDRLNAGFASMALTLVGGILLAGCAQKSVHAVVPVYVAPSPQEVVRPMTTAPDTDATPPLEASAAPPIPSESPATEPVTIPSKAALPPPPKPVVEQRSTELAPEAPARAQAPQISPQLSPGDQATYQRKINEDTAIAEKNLHETDGRQLSAAQQDLVEKIRSFLGQSVEASKGGDWARAENLSQKARSLSIELMNSL